MKAEKHLIAYIEDKYGYKVKDIKYGYIVLQQESHGADCWWKLYNNKVYTRVSEIIDELLEIDKKAEQRRGTFNKALNEIEKYLENK